MLPKPNWHRGPPPWPRTRLAQCRRRRRRASDLKETPHPTGRAEPRSRRTTQPHPASIEPRSVSPESNPTPRPPPKLEPLARAQPASSPVLPRETEGRFRARRARSLRTELPQAPERARVVGQCRSPLRDHQIPRQPSLVPLSPRSNSQEAANQKGTADWPL